MRFPRRSSLIVAGASVAIASLLPVAPSASAQTNDFPEGSWSGSINFSGPSTLAGLEVLYSSHGAFDIFVTTTGIDGAWNLRVSSILPEVGQDSAAVASADGFVVGDSAAASLELDSITVQPSIGAPLTFSADELPTPGAGSLTVTGFECNALIGDWTIPFSESVLEGTFIAQHLRPGAPRTPRDEFHETGARILSDIGDGTINIGQILAYIGQAERFAEGSTLRGEGCDAVTAYRFSTAATSMIDTILAQAIAAGFDIDDETFLALYRAGFRTGAFDFNPALFLTWENQFDFRLFGAVSSEDPDDWEFWLPIAREFGEKRAELALVENIRDDDVRQGN